MFVVNLQGNVHKLEMIINNQILGVNPFTPTNDQDRISPYNIKQVGDENREEYQSWDYWLI